MDSNNQLDQARQAKDDTDVHIEVAEIISKNEQAAASQATATVYLEDWGQMYRKPNGTWVGGGDQFPSSTELAKRCEALLATQKIQKE